MPDMNSWWTGHNQALIPRLDMVSAAWGSGDKAANKLRMLNGAFEIYFLLKTSIGQCEDSTMQAEMTKELDDAGTSGSGFGVNDLDDAFQHWRKPGNWTDNNEKSYSWKPNG